MKVTKKTRLLAKPLKHVTIDEMTAFVFHDTESAEVLLKVGNPEGISGFDGSYGMDVFDGDVFVDGAPKGSLSFVGTRSDGSKAQVGNVDSGQVVKVVLHIDPSKTDFDQNDVVREVVAV